MGLQTSLSPAPAQADRSPLYSISGVDIFRVGEWNGDEYEASDLDAMVAAFAKQGFGVPLKYGHDDTAGLPAVGWVDRIYRAGDVLKADFRDLSFDAYTAILDHQYDHVSCEIFWNLKRDGSTYTRALKAVALLGAETPAVSGLKPLREATFSEDQFEKVTHASLQVVSRQMAAQDQNADIAKTLKDQGETIAALQAQIKADKDAAAAALKVANEQIAAMAAQRAKDALTALSDKCKIPAIRQHISHLYEFALTDGASKVAKFTDDKGAVSEKSLTAVLDEIVQWANTIAESKTRTLSAGKLTVVPKDDGGDYEDASAEVDRLAKLYMAEHKLTGADGYGKAQIAVLKDKTNSELATRYATERRGAA